MRLVATRDSSGALGRIYVRVLRSGHPTLMTFDTGVPVTTLTHDSTTRNSEIKNAEQLRIFCDRRWLDSTPQSPLNGGGWNVNGVRVIGTLGNDVLDLGVVEVDARRRLVELHPKEWTPEGNQWTGGWLTMLFDRNADMSPPVTTTHDWVGNEIMFKEIPGHLTLGDGPTRRVPVQRTRRYPVFEGWMSSTGIEGAIGITSIDSEHFVIDRERKQLWLTPSTRRVNRSEAPL